MAQSIKEIKQIILDKKAEASQLDPLEVLTEQEQQNLTSTSRVSIWNLFAYVFASVAWVQQKLFDQQKIDVDKILLEGQIHTKEWYRQKALAFQYGYALIPDTDKYPFPEDYQEAQAIQSSKVIKQASIIKRGNSILRCKTATDENGELVPVSEEVLEAFGHYMNLVADAGTSILPTSDPADDLKIVVIIHFDPLVINNDGTRRDGTNDTPVIDAIKEFLKSITFDGQLIIADLQKAIRAVPGVLIADIESAASKFGFHSYDDITVNNVGSINQFRIAESGYMKLDEAFSVLTYVSSEENITTNQDIYAR